MLSSLRIPLTTPCRRSVLLHRFATSPAPRAYFWSRNEAPDTKKELEAPAAEPDDIAAPYIPPQPLDEQELDDLLLNDDEMKRHPLSFFFRQVPSDDRQRMVMETMEPPSDQTGRAWEADELRRKSFKDLHILWYILLRERNLLATQIDEARRMGFPSIPDLPSTKKAVLCRKSMARVMQVLGERRLAVIGANQLLARDCDVALQLRSQRPKPRGSGRAKKAQEAQASDISSEPASEAGSGAGEDNASPKEHAMTAERRAESQTSSADGRPRPASGPTVTLEEALASTSERSNSRPARKVKPRWSRAEKRARKALMPPSNTVEGHDASVQP